MGMCATLDVEQTRYMFQKGKEGAGTAYPYFDFVSKTPPFEMGFNKPCRLHSSEILGVNNIQSTTVVCFS